MIPRNVLFLFLVSFILSCSSPQELYDKGNYFKAYDKVLKELQGNKKKRRNVILLNRSFSKMIEKSRKDLIPLEDGYRVKDLEHNFEKYYEVEKRFVKGRSFIDDENQSQYEIFLDEKEVLLSDAYQEGQDLMVYYEESRNKIDAQNAFFHFELVQEFGGQFENISDLMKKSKEAGTVIYNIDADLDSDFSFQWDVDRQFDDLEGNRDFLKVVYDNSWAEYDCFIELDFSRLDVDEAKTETEQNYTKRILDGYEIKIDDKGNEIKTPVYVDVSGTVNTISIRKKVSWRIDLEIMKSNVNCTLRERNFYASVDDNVEYYTLFGDERAIPDTFKLNNENEVESTDDMVDQLLQNLYNQVRNYIY